uniref:AlNc14C343G10825 protein n=1 Tax=Albugo laibachii Nc14 TaxID=890382 RepID=F0WX67_9STRA|nr:AlNc14C343G10825 [Albugo laibachii Nc14]|eukprot:CCA26058.1 AlNc14C343G10825 [Albugo laibachii Nc14]
MALKNITSRLRLRPPLCFLDSDNAIRMQCAILTEHQWRGFGGDMHLLHVFNELKIVRSLIVCILDSGVVSVPSQFELDFRIMTMAIL